MEENNLSQILELGTEELIQAAITNNEGVIASNGALSLETGARTGRSPNDRFIVQEDSTSHLIDWGNINKPFDADKFLLLWDKVDAYLAERDRYLSKVHVGAHEDHYIPVNVVAESASHSMFSKLIFINPSEFNHQGKQEWQILSALNYQCAPEEDGT
ncbi:MAG: phosphoenolpyruvate carboxykinase (ATP), partial [Gammaproteobacteria bacterium]